jgi:hypothetical protein
MNYKNILLINVMLMMIQGLQAQDDTETRNSVETYPVTKETSMEVSNKYGTVQITAWNKDSVMIRAEVKATAENHEKLSKMFDGVSINIFGAKNKVMAQTSFSQNITMLFENFKGMTSKLITYDSRIEINYYIKVPEYLNMKIENKYGDIYMENCTGELTLNLSNGSLNAGNIGKDSNLNLTFCDANIESLASGRIYGSFSDIELKNAGDISINSISSKYNFTKTGKINMESRRDKFRINNITSIKGTSYFTDFDITALQKEATISARYGKIDFQEVASGFDAINLNTGYTDISLEFEPGSSYNVDIRHVNAFVVISDKSAKTDRKVLNEDKKEYITTGTVGKGPASSRVNIDATHGDIYLK